MAEIDEKKASKKLRLGKKYIVIAVVVVVVVAAVTTSVYFYKQYQKSQQLLQNPSLAAQQETQELMQKVGKLMELPTDEAPEQIATVSDVTKLSGQPFFAKAKNGDKLLIYVKNKMAILYDPEHNIIVTVAPINIAQPTVPATPTPTRKAAPLIRVTPKLSPAQ